MCAEPVDRLGDHIIYCPNQGTFDSKGRCDKILRVERGGVLIFKRRLFLSNWDKKVALKIDFDTDRSLIWSLLLPSSWEFLDSSANMSMEGLEA